LCAAPQVALLGFDYQYMAPTIHTQNTIKIYGADSTRLHLLFSAPPEEVLEWDDSSIVGMQRWLFKVWGIVCHAVEGGSLNVNVGTPDVDAMGKEERDMYRTTHHTIKEVTNSLTSSFRFNTVVSDLIKLTNQISAAPPSIKKTFAYGHAVRSLILMMSPLAPSMGEECWEMFQGAEGREWRSVFEESWLQVDQRAFAVDEVMCVVQFNGKTRFEMPITVQLLNNPTSLENAIRSSDGWTKRVKDETCVVKTVHVKGGRLVNFVMK